MDAPPETQFSPPTPASPSTTISGERVPQKRRKQRIVITHCLNCGTAIAGHFCHDCGQEAHDQSVALGTVAAELIAEVLSFDSKVLRTILPLLFRPGFLTNEFSQGRRVRYLSPIKMYLVISALFFFVLAQQNTSKDANKFHFYTGDNLSSTTKAALSDASRDMDKELAQAKTPQQRVHLLKARAQIAKITPILAAPASPKTPPHATTVHIGFSNTGSETLPDTVAAYNTQQAALPRSRRDPPLKRFLMRRVIKTKQSPSNLLQGFLDDLPRMMFVLLPAFALLLKTTYWRTKRLYVSHLIFALHTHAFVFLLATGALLLPLAHQGEALGIASLLTVIYLYAALKVVYAQTWGRTLLAFGWLSFNYLFLLTFAFALTLGAAFLLA